MCVLKTPAPKKNGLASGNYYYVAGWYRDGERYVATITLDIRRAKAFGDETEADNFNRTMMSEGNFAKPFTKQKLI